MRRLLLITPHQGFTLLPATVPSKQRHANSSPQESFGKKVDEAAPLITDPSSYGLGEKVF